MPHVTMSDYILRDEKEPSRAFPRIGRTRDFTIPPEEKIKPHRLLENNIVEKPWSDRRCFIVGGGDSLKGFDFEKLKGEIVIAVNRSVEAVPWASMLIFLDEQFFGWSASGQLGENMQRIFDEFQSYKVTFSRIEFPFPEDIIKVKFKQLEDGILSDRLGDGLYSGSNSGFAALNIAATLGAKEIYLLGFDMIEGDGQGRQKWHHDGYPDKQDDSVYKMYKDDFIQAAPKLQERGVRVVNLNPDSGLKCFDFGTYKEIKRFRTPIVCSFYTDEYKDLAARMVRSVQFFGFEHDVVRIEKKGNWLDTIYSRAEFIKEMLLNHGRDVVWIDCDAVMERYPKMFENFRGDFGVHIHDWPDGRKELLGGTMYFARTLATDRLIERWVELNKTMPKQNLSQKVLQEAVAGFDGKIVQFPGTYCQIFDLMAEEGDPIISHWQASRQFREA